MPIQTKICGLSTPETLDAAIKGGASHIGFVFFGKSPRNVSIERAQVLAARVPDHVRTVSVLVDPDAAFLDRLLSSVKIDILQLHGAEPPEMLSQIRSQHRVELWKAIPVRTRSDLDTAARFAGSADRILFDAKTGDDSLLPGGMGVRFDWNLLNGFRHTLPWALSGGLDPANLAEAVRVTAALLIDVSSGVETAPGVKDVDKIAAFLKAAHSL